MRNSICFVSETGRKDRPIQDPSVRYRCYHPAEILSQKGFYCPIYSAAQFYEDPCFDYDVYVFHRPNAARQRFLQTVEHLRKLGRTLIADYDDLIFGDEQTALQSSAVKNKTLSESAAIDAFLSNLAALKWFDKVTVSTEQLAAHVKSSNSFADVRAFPNLIPPSVIAVHEEVGTPYMPRSATTIGYFAGTKSHDHDFPVVEEVLHRVLCENREFHLLVVGPVAIPSSIASLPNVSVAPVVNFLRLSALMSKCSTVIAPLERTVFNECKSRVKFLEAALSGCNLVATPIPDMQAVGGERVYLASNKNDWYEALSFSASRPMSQDKARANFEFLRDHTVIEKLAAFLEGR